MFLSRFFGRTRFAASKLETSAASASAPLRTAINPLEEFFEVERNPEDEKPAVYGNATLLLVVLHLQALL